MVHILLPTSGVTTFGGARRIRTSTASTETHRSNYSRVSSLAVIGAIGAIIMAAAPGCLVPLALAARTARTARTPSTPSSNVASKLLSRPSKRHNRNNRNVAAFSSCLGHTNNNISSQHRRHQPHQPHRPHRPHRQCSTASIAPLAPIRFASQPTQTDDGSLNGFRISFFHSFRSWTSPSSTTHTTHTTRTTKAMPNRKSSSTTLFMSDDDDNQSEEEPKMLQTEYNLPNLKKEITRLALRTHKKIGKAHVRLQAAKDQLDQLRKEMDQTSSNIPDEDMLQKLENAPSTNLLQEYQTDLNELQSRLQQLNYLEEVLNQSPWKKKKTASVGDLASIVLPDEMREVLEDDANNSNNANNANVAQLIQHLGISDDYETEKLKRVQMDEANKRSKKQRAELLKEQGGNGGNGGGGGGGNGGGRLPYRRYYTEGNIEIRVGKQATDNDVLSLSPQHRHPSHWWFHASGCPGSHVVLCTDDDPSSSQQLQEAILDAASLAALKSKCIHQSTIKVSMTRCRNVSKPPGAKAGLVTLNGDVRTVAVKKGEVERRCERLEGTVVVN